MADAEFILRPIAVPQAGSGARPLLDRVHDWIVTVDHKRLGLMYVLYGILFLVIAGLEATAMRIQLAIPNNHFVSPQVFNQLFTMHGTTMVFLVGMPIIFGFANYLAPLMIGARDMAFPRLNAFSLVRPKSLVLGARVRRGARIRTKDQEPRTKNQGRTKDLGRTKYQAPNTKD
jgi:hypothetical protein